MAWNEHNRNIKNGLDGRDRRRPEQTRHIEEDVYVH